MFLKWKTIIIITFIRYNLSIKQQSPSSSPSSSVTSEQQRQLEPLPTFGRSANDDSTLSILIANTKHIWPIFVDKFSSTNEEKIDKNPLDKYTKQSVETAINETLSSFSHNSDTKINNDKYITVDYDVRYTFELEPKRFVAFQQLCQDSGFAYYNRVCFLNVHKEIGPWFGLRAVGKFKLHSSSVFFLYNHNSYIGHTKYFQLTWFSKIQGVAI